ncbi:protein DMR6-LIKE OXYGENASE 2-like [Cryptomeria japonica]|uniref:protein DMR6-LIKE OXYGENASE 2-like n=1 Tax=Cryptomeria japonica TaxID=3369 RepID=UPI0025AC6B2D|nr:protein DMR6-LIKE OXYGENASE 2-like [Cryptomeria japonica]
MENVNFLQEFMGVKAMVEKGLDRVPHGFIRSLQERPKDSQDEEHENIPVIDLQEQVVNHGIAPSSMNEMMEAAREFFELPDEQKMKYFTLDTMSKFRYASSFNLQKDKILSWRDFILYSCHPLDDAISQWPSSPPTFR